MSMICNCPQCGGTDDWQVCNNGMQDAWLEMHKIDKAWGRVIICAVVVILLTILF